VGWPSRSCPAAAAGAEPDLVLLVFLPPLLFIAAIERRELRRWIWPIARLAVLPFY
jgi:NhaP-type Na+/H+ or K+/H+ antiporter